MPRSPKKLTFFNVAIFLGTIAAGGGAVESRAESRPILVTSPVAKVFEPLGFDDNDNAEVVIYGHFQNTCFKVGPASAIIDAENMTITIDAKAWFYQGVMCGQMVVPFIQTVKLGVVPAGRYQVSVIDRSAAETIPFDVVPSATRSPDDFLYAPVDGVTIDLDQAGHTEFVLSGTYPMMLVGCMKVVEVRERVTPGNVIVILPIAQIFTNDSDCTDQQNSKKFTVKQPLTGVDQPAAYLAHVRALNGQSINRLFDMGH